MVAVNPTQIIDILGKICSSRRMIEARLKEAASNPDKKAEIYAEIKPELERAVKLIYTVASRNGYNMPNRALSDAEIDQQIR
jgi:hypothetical protein